MIKNYFNLKIAQFTMERNLVENTQSQVMKNLENGFILTMAEDIQNDNQIFFILANGEKGDVFRFKEDFSTYQEAQKTLNKIPIYMDVKNHPAWIDVKNDPKFAKLENH
jgi:hypothetical protein